MTELSGVFSAGKDGSGIEAYALAVGGYSDMTLARNAAELIKGRGGAGYVISGDSIEIIYAVYPDEESAKKVLVALDESSAYVKQIKINIPKYKWADGDVKTAVDAAMGYYKISFDSLYNTANALADGSMGVEDARTKIRVLTAQINDIKSAFYQSVSEIDNEDITQIKLALITALALLDNIKTTGSVPQFVSSLRYALVQLVYCRQAL